MNHDANEVFQCSMRFGLDPQWDEMGFGWLWPFLEMFRFKLSDLHVAGSESWVCGCCFWNSVIMCDSFFIIIFSSKKRGKNPKMATYSACLNWALASFTRGFTRWNQPVFRSASIVLCINAAWTICCDHSVRWARTSWRVFECLPWFFFGGCGTWILCSPIVGMMIPFDFHSFQRGRYTTNQSLLYDGKPWKMS